MTCKMLTYNKRYDHLSLLLTPQRIRNMNVVWLDIRNNTSSAVDPHLDRTPDVSNGDWINHGCLAGTGRLESRACCNHQRLASTCSLT